MVTDKSVSIVNSYIITLLIYFVRHDGLIAVNRNHATKITNKIDCTEAHTL